jgi:hypothetical protein
MIPFALALVALFVLGFMLYVWTIPQAPKPESINIPVPPEFISVKTATSEGSDADRIISNDNLDNVGNIDDASNTIIAHDDNGPETTDTTEQSISDEF